MGLAGEIGVELTRDDATAAYDRRSRLVHGDRHSLPEADRELYRRLENVLRGAIRRGIEDEEFRGVFRSDEQIRERWPLKL